MSSPARIATATAPFPNLEITTQGRPNSVHPSALSALRPIDRGATIIHPYIAPDGSHLQVHGHPFTGDVHQKAVGKGPQLRRTLSAASLAALGFE